MLAFDLQGVGSAALLWLWLGLAHPATLIVVLLARTPLWLWLLHRRLEPVLAWERSLESRADGELLLRADRELQDIPRRFAWQFSLTWAGSLALITASSFAQIPASAPMLGDSERLAIVLLTCASVLPGPAFYGAIVSRLLAPMTEELSTLLLARKLEPQRTPSSLSTQLARFTNSLLVAVLLLSSAIIIERRGERLRQHTTDEQLRLAELSAVLVDHGEVPLAGVELVDADALPPELAALLDASGNSVTSQYISTLGLSVALAPTQTQGVALASARPDENIYVVGGGLVLLFGLLLPLVWFATIEYARGVSEPLERFGGAAHDFTEVGTLHDLERIVPMRADEIGRLAHRLNGLFDTLEELAVAAERVAQGDLRVELAHPGALHDAFGAMIQRLREMVGELRETSLELGSASTEILTLMQEQALAATQQAAAVSQAKQSIAALAGSAGQIATATHSVVADVERSAEVSDLVTAKIAALQAQTGSIGALLAQIREIADRSDLLALNGSLEAVRAGDVGRGFALVAAQMRRLAERIAGILVDAATQLTQLETAGIETATAAERGSELAKRAALAAREISTVTAVQDQQTSSADAGMGEISELTLDAARLTTQTRDAAQGLRRHAFHLETLIEAFHDE